jgi:hypothetical protein
MGRSGDGYFGQAKGATWDYAPLLMRAWALVELGDHEAIDVFVRKEDALKALEMPSAMSRNGVARLLVVPIELDDSNTSEN